MVLMALQDEAQTTIVFLFLSYLWKQLSSFWLYIIFLTITF